VNTQKLIHYATLAPSGHNTQPWKFSVNENVIHIYPDFSRCLPVVDPDDHALYISLGCALENLIIAAGQIGHKSIVDYFPKDEKEECIRVTLNENGNDDVEDIYRAITVRQSNRSMYNGKEIPDDDVQKLRDANVYDTVNINIFKTNDKDIEPIIEFVKEANRIQFNDKRFVQELISWMRFSKKEMRNRKDGLTAEVMGFPFVPRWLGRIIIKTFVKPEREASKCEKQIRSSSIMMLFIGKKNDKKHWMDIGRSFERVALTATSLGIAHAHINMPCEVVSIREKLARHIGVTENEEPLLLIRFGYAKKLPRSPRRPMKEIMKPL